MDRNAGLKMSSVKLGGVARQAGMSFGREESVCLRVDPSCYGRCRCRGFPSGSPQELSLPSCSSVRVLSPVTVRRSRHGAAWQARPGADAVTAPLCTHAVECNCFRAGVFPLGDLFDIVWQVAASTDCGGSWTCQVRGPISAMLRYEDLPGPWSASLS